MIGNPGLLQERPDISALLPQGGGEAEQPIPPNRTLAGMAARADFSLNHQLAQGTLSPIVGGLDPPWFPAGAAGGRAAQRSADRAQRHHPLAATGLLHPGDRRADRLAP